MAKCRPNGPHDAPCKPLYDHSVYEGYSDACECGCGFEGDCDAYREHIAWLYSLAREAHAMYHEAPMNGEPMQTWFAIVQHIEMKVMNRRETE